jgi:hypothetical protein
MTMPVRGLPRPNGLLGHDRVRDESHLGSWETVQNLVVERADRGRASIEGVDSMDQIAVLLAYRADGHVVITDAGEHLGHVAYGGAVGRQGRLLGHHQAMDR